MRRLGRAVAGLGILLLLAGAAMAFAGWRMGGESWLEIEAAGLQGERHGQLYRDAPSRRNSVLYGCEFQRLLL